MKREIDPLQTRLTVLRNLSASSFLSLSNTAGPPGEPAMRTQFTDVSTWGRINGAIVNIRKRYDSYRTLVSTLSTAAGSDGAVALAQSMIAHIGMIYKWLDESGVEVLSEQYAERLNPIIEMHLAELLKEGDSISSAIASKFAQPLNLFENTPALPCYWFCVKLAVRYALGIMSKTQFEKRS